MKKMAVGIALVMLATTVAPLTTLAKVNRPPGGIPAFVVGCCWGIREGTEWNEGADMHWREWMRIVPIVGFVIAVWDGADCYTGITAHEWAQQNGANWY